MRFDPVSDLVRVVVMAAVVSAWLLPVASPRRIGEPVEHGARR